MSFLFIDLISFDLNIYSHLHICRHPSRRRIFCHQQPSRSFWNKHITKKSSSERSSASKGSYGKEGKPILLVYRCSTKPKSIKKILFQVSTFRHFQNVILMTRWSVPKFHSYGEGTSNKLHKLHFEKKQNFCTHYYLCIQQFEIAKLVPIFESKKKSILKSWNEKKEWINKRILAFTIVRDLRWDRPSPIYYRDDIK